MGGFEPLTYRATVCRSNQLSYTHRRDFRLPIAGFRLAIRNPQSEIRNAGLVGASGLEPPTSCSQGRRASQTAPRPDWPSGPPNYSAPRRKVKERRVCVSSPTVAHGHGGPWRRAGRQAPRASRRAAAAPNTCSFRQNFHFLVKNGDFSGHGPSVPLKGYRKSALRGPPTYGGRLAPGPLPPPTGPQGGAEGRGRAKHMFIPAKFPFSRQKPRFPWPWALYAPQRLPDARVYHMNRRLSIRIANNISKCFDFQGYSGFFHFRLSISGVPALGHEDSNTE